MVSFPVALNDLGFKVTVLFKSECLKTVYHPAADDSFT